VSPQLSSPNQPYSLREALAQAQSSRIGATTRALRESLHPVLRQKLVNNLISNCCSLNLFILFSAESPSTDNNQQELLSILKDAILLLAP
jgi:hypothetical protein